MRSIGEIPNEADAKRFGDYLYANGIASDVDEDEGTWTVWIHDDEQITKAEEELSVFLKNADNQRYAKGAKEAGKLREQEAKDNERTAKRQIDVRTQMLGQDTGVTPFLTFFMIGLCVLAAFFCYCVGRIGQFGLASASQVLEQLWPRLQTSPPDDLHQLSSRIAVPTAIALDHELLTGSRCACTPDAVVAGSALLRSSLATGCRDSACPV